MLTFVDTCTLLLLVYLRRLGFVKDLPGSRLMEPYIYISMWEVTNSSSVKTNVNLLHFKKFISCRFMRVSTSENAYVFFSMQV